MRSATYKEIKSNVARLAGATGFPVDSPSVLERVNYALEELTNAVECPGVVDRYTFTVYDGIITLPGDLDRILGVAQGNVPLAIRSPWYEYSLAGPGPQNAYNGNDCVIDQGEAVTFRDLPVTDAVPFYTLRVKGKVDERVDGVRPKIRILGYDGSGNWVNNDSSSGSQDGIDIEIDGDSSSKVVEATTVFSSIEAIIKPVTKGQVELWAYSASTGEFQIANYAPRETTPSYRRYFVPSVQTGTKTTISVRARRRFVPITGDNDILPISNLAAIRKMLIAVEAEEARDFQSYAAYRAGAIKILEDEAKAYRGNIASPAITFAQTYGISNAHIQ